MLLVTLSLSTAIVCNELSAIENGMISYFPDSEGPEYDLDNMATYTCNDGYMLIGNSASRECQVSSVDNTVASFEGSAPSCGRVAIVIMFAEPEYTSSESNGSVVIRVVTDRPVEGPVTFYIIGGEFNINTF